MPRYRFTGTATEVFPTILSAAGVLVLEPGQIVDLAQDVDHPRLVRVRKVDEPDVDVRGSNAAVELTHLPAAAIDEPADDSAGINHGEPDGDDGDDDDDDGDEDPSTSADGDTSTTSPEA